MIIPEIWNNALLQDSSGYLIKIRTLCNARAPFLSLKNYSPNSPRTYLNSLVNYD